MDNHDHDHEDQSIRHMVRAESGISDYVFRTESINEHNDDDGGSGFGAFDVDNSDNVSMTDSIATPFGDDTVPSLFPNTTSNNSNRMTNMMMYNQNNNSNTATAATKKPAKQRGVPTATANKQSGDKKKPKTVGSLVAHFNERPLLNDPTTNTKARGSLKVHSSALQSPHKHKLKHQQQQQPPFENYNSNDSYTITLPSGKPFHLANVSTDSQTSIDSFAHQIHEELRDHNDNDDNKEHNATATTTATTTLGGLQEDKSVDAAPNEAFWLTTGNHGQTQQQQQAPDNSGNGNGNDSSSALTSTLQKYGIAKNKTPRIRESMEMDPNFSLVSNASSVPYARQSVIAKQTMITLRMQSIFNDEKQSKFKLFLPRQQSSDSMDCQILIVWVNTGSTVKSVKTFVENAYPHQMLLNKISSFAIADEDGDIDDDFPPISDKQDMTSLGMSTFYIHRVFMDEIQIEPAFVGIPENKHLTPVPPSNRNNNNDDDASARLGLLAGVKSNDRYADTYNNNNNNNRRQSSIDESLNGNPDSNDTNYGTFNSNVSIFCCFCCSSSSSRNKHGDSKQNLLLAADDEFDESNIDHASDEEEDEEEGDGTGPHSRSKSKLFSYETRDKTGYQPPIQVIQPVIVSSSNHSKTDTDIQHIKNYNDRNAKQEQGQQQNKNHNHNGFVEQGNKQRASREADGVQSILL